MKTVEDILLSGENLEIGSDSDISDASQIRNFNFLPFHSFSMAAGFEPWNLGLFVDCSTSCAWGAGTQIRNFYFWPFHPLPAAA